MMEYPCKKVNGVKYYENINKVKEDNPSEHEVFSIINDEKYLQNDIPSSSINSNTAGKKFYEDAWAFKDRLNTLGLASVLQPQYAVNDNGHTYHENHDNMTYYQEGKMGDYIFQELNNTGGRYIEDKDSDFNAHRLQVIKHSVETNLMTAINNYNDVSSVETRFAMPKLKDTDWEKITDNVCMITFLQGLSIGGKIYSGYSIVHNNTNEDFVSEDAIYIIADGKYHKPTDPDLLTHESQVGVFNIEFERRTGTATYKRYHYRPGTDEKIDPIYDSEGNIIDYEHEEFDKYIYYYPYTNDACYDSIVDSNGNNFGQSISEYLSNLDGVENNDVNSNEYKLAQVYYTALGRERYGLYRVSNKLEKIQEYLNSNPS